MARRSAGLVARGKPRLRDVDTLDLRHPHERRPHTVTIETVGTRRFFRLVRP